MNERKVAPMKTPADMKAEADRIRADIERAVEDETDLADYFEGGVYGEDAAGRWIVGFGVWGGSGNITLDPSGVQVCGIASEPFSPRTSKAVRELFSQVANA